MVPPPPQGPGQHRLRRLLLEAAMCSSHQHLREAQDFHLDNSPRCGRRHLQQRRQVEARSPSGSSKRLLQLVRSRSEVAPEQPRSVAAAAAATLSHSDSNTQALRQLLRHRPDLEALLSPRPPHREAQPSLSEVELLLAVVLEALEPYHRSSSSRPQVVSGRLRPGLELLLGHSLDSALVRRRRTGELLGRGAPRGVDCHCSLRLKKKKMIEEGDLKF